MTLLSHGILAHRGGRLDEAAALFAAALAIHRATGNPRSEGIARLNLGSVNIERRNLEDARIHLEASRDLAHATGSWGGVGIALAGLGEMHVEAGAHDEARTHFEQALVIHRELGDRRMEGIQLGNLARIDELDGAHDRARARFEEALAIHREIGDRHYEGGCLANLASFLFDRGERREARAALDAAESILRELGALLELARARCVRAELEQAEGDAVAAGAAFDEAERLAAELGSPPGFDFGRAFVRARAALGRGRVWSGRRGCVVPLDVATVARLLIGGRRDARDHRVERRPEVRAVRRVARARARLVETSAVGEDAVAVEEEEVGRARGVEREGDLLRIVDEEREVPALVLGQFLHVLRSVLRIGDDVVRVDRDDADPLRDVLPAEASEFGQDVPDERTVVADEEEERAFRSAHVGRTEIAPGHRVGERERRDLGAQRKHPRRGLGHGGLLSVGVDDGTFRSSHVRGPGAREAFQPPVRSHDPSPRRTTNFFVDTTNIFVEHGPRLAHPETGPMTDEPTTNETPRPTDAELAILRVLWDRGPSTVREGHEALSATQNSGYTTVLKLLQIMTDKGLVVRDESNRAHVYAASATMQRTQQKLLGDLVDRAFGGSSASLVLQALSGRPATSAELRDIRALLDRIEKEGSR